MRLESNFFQIRPMVNFDRPVRAAIEAATMRVLARTDSKVATTTSST